MQFLACQFGKKLFAMCVIGQSKNLQRSKHVDIGYLMFGTVPLHLPLPIEEDASVVVESETDS